MHRKYAYALMHTGLDGQEAMNELSSNCERACGSSRSCSWLMTGWYFASIVGDVERGCTASCTVTIISGS